MKERYEALDVLRGLTMVIMALDHSRDFFALGYVQSDPTNLAYTTLPVFLTRFVTHLAAPTFMFLAGIGIYFASRRRSTGEVAKLCWTRGVWLMFLELTVMAFFWSFSIRNFAHPEIATLFAIGAAMVSMAGLVYLPRWAIGVISAAMILGHNAFDNVSADSLGSFGWAWHLIHSPGTFSIGPIEVRVLYPFVPWIGVMALGFLFGPVTTMPRLQRKKIFLGSGLSMLALGLIIRWINIYGDGEPWSVQSSWQLTVASFLNYTKYPPSLVFVFVLLGSAMILMSLFDRELGKWSLPLRHFGKVPFFFYILHIPLLHLGGLLLALIVFGRAEWLFGTVGGDTPFGTAPSDLSYGSDLLPTYVAWITVVVLLYWPCRWFSKLKSTRKDWWLSYL